MVKYLHSIDFGDVKCIQKNKHSAVHIKIDEQKCSLEMLKYLNSMNYHIGFFY